MFMRYQNMDLGVEQYEIYGAEHTHTHTLVFSSRCKIRARTATFGRAISSDVRMRPFPGDNIRCARDARCVFCFQSIIIILKPSSPRINCRRTRVRTRTRPSAINFVLSLRLLNGY